MGMNDETRFCIKADSMSEMRSNFFMSYGRDNERRNGLVTGTGRQGLRAGVLLGLV